MLLGATALAGCGEQGELLAPERNASLFGSETQLIECPAAETAEGTGIIGPEGGALQVGKHELRIQAGAVAEPTSFSLTVPASRYMEVDIRADGLDHFTFLEPVSVTVSYARCSDSYFSLSAWQIHPDSYDLLENMGGVVHTLSKRVTFSTDHLSTFALAN